METTSPDIVALRDKAVGLLEKLLATPSLSRSEDKTAPILKEFLESEGFEYKTKGNNVWAESENHLPGAPVILLNSHHDTVKPATDWTKEPFAATYEGEKLYGLGSNDAGASLVSLATVFATLAKSETTLPYKLIFASTAEEEISGPNGVASVLPELPTPDLGIVGEPTKCQMAVAEKGLIVIDATAEGVAGHAAREEGINAIYKAMTDIEWLATYTFPKMSETLGPVKVSVTQIEAGSQHNVVPDRCSFVIDVRTTDRYTNEEIVEIIDQNTRSVIKPRSCRLNSSGLPADHPAVLKAEAMGLERFGSPTLSDQALMSFPTVKIGPGDSARSHTADEYILVSEIEQGIRTYLELLDGLKL
ncbi:acetylornithine deacetylase (plasmid) [Fulvitalea axinellae]|uniref:Acetylornithine deacetylase n=1 Tax=Fulvitalea axinellae TaxID=1182444 RepID=A0AAU9D1M9_9BACT|nr:acetylornithine deacetylase [Fulvitalea axinellae]